MKKTIIVLAVTVASLVSILLAASIISYIVNISRENSVLSDVSLHANKARSYISLYHHNKKTLPPDLSDFWSSIEPPKTDAFKSRIIYKVKDDTWFIYIKDRSGKLIKFDSGESQKGSAVSDQSKK